MGLWLLALPVSRLLLWSFAPDAISCQRSTPQQAIYSLVCQDVPRLQCHPPRINYGSPDGSCGVNVVCSALAIVVHLACPATRTFILANDPDRMN